MKNYKMFKIFFILLITLLLCSCTKNEYQKIVDKLKLINKENINNYPFSININIEKITDSEIMYSLIIDDIKENMNDIKAIVIHDKQTENIFPSIGIADNSVSLLKNGDKKGISLVGYIQYKKTIESFKGTLKAYVSYYSDNNVFKEFYYKRQY